MTTTQIVVVGGGYAGVLAANRLLQRADVDVALINPRPQFVERIRLHQLVAGTDDAVADSAQVNAAIEAMVREAPSQYLWIHRRFKRQPEGRSTFYERD